MADYYPLIARAVAGLDKNTGEVRRVLYDRARAALVVQLRSVDPQLNESDITRERLALEEAIRKVETEASKRRPETAEDSRSSLSDEGLRGFRAVVAEAQNLGGAAAEANRAAHDVSERVPAAPALPEQPEVAAATAVEPPLAEDRVADAPPSHEPLSVPPVASRDDGSRETPPPRPETRSEPAWRPPPPRFDTPGRDEQADYAPRVRSYGGLIKGVVFLLIIAAVVGVGYWQRHTLTSLVAGRRAPPASTQQQATQTGVRPKITDRVGAGAQNAANAPTALVAQKVVLYDEDASNPNGKRYVGSALWRTETVSPGPGLAPEIAVRADVEIPERHMHMTWSLRRNTDPALPASHTIEIMFTLPADFSEGGIGNVPGVLMKADEQARGVPLAGLAVKVTNGYFLIGLSAVSVDVQRNIDLLKNRDWFDVPIVYTNGKRAILAIEKGPAGARVFDEAFRAWGQ